MRTGVGKCSLPLSLLPYCAIVPATAIDCHRLPPTAAIYVGREQSWSAARTLTWAAEAGLQFVSVQALRNWVALAVEPMLLQSGDAVGDPRGLIFRQLWDTTTSTFTYLLGDPSTRQAIIIDPVLERAERDAMLARELGLHLTLALNTHVHADHISGTGKLKSLVPGLRSAIGTPGAHADVHLKDGDAVHFGGRSLRARATPGHTGGCFSFVLDDESAVFTGDALFVRGCGRTDFQVGNATTLYDSITRVIFALPTACTIYPGHDYNGHTRSTVGEERLFNPRLGAGRSLSEFVAIMGSLNLPPPKLLDVSVPANLLDGNAPGASTYDQQPLPPVVCAVPPA